MNKRAILILGVAALILVSFSLVTAQKSAVAPSRAAIPIPAEQIRPVTPPLAVGAKDYCFLDYTNWNPVYFYDQWKYGDKVAIYFDPEDCGYPVNYPFQLTDVHFYLYDHAGIGACSLRFSVEVVCPDICDGPGIEIWKSPTYNITTFYPDLMEVYFDDTVCLDKPFFFNVEFLQGPQGMVPSLLWDDQMVDTCYQWIWMGQPAWYEWHEFFGAGAPGWVCLGVSGYVADQAQCGEWYWKPDQPDQEFPAPSGMPDFDQNQLDWSAYCGPTAVANCLWWYNAVPPGMSPPEFIELLAGYFSTNVGISGTHVDSIQAGLERYFDDYGFALVETTYWMPDFYEMEDSLKKCQDIILLLGFWWYEEGTEQEFIRGDVNEDGAVDAADIADCLDGPPFSCDDAADVNDDGVLNTLDCDYLTDFLYSSGPPPPPPFPDCGVDPTADALGCADFPPCPPGGSGEWFREGGHFVTMAGVNSEKKEIAISDPDRDQVVRYPWWPGRVRMADHLPWGMYDGTYHNNTQYVSHDVYVSLLFPEFPSPGSDVWDLADYCYGQTFPLMNVPHRFEAYSRAAPKHYEYFHTEVEAAVMICPKPTPDTVRNHFKTWRVEPEPFTEIVVVQDQFMEDDLVLDMIEFFSNPVRKNTFEIVDSLEHLTWYRAHGRDTLLEVEYTNQFGTYIDIIDSVRYLLLPTAKEFYPFPENLDHYKAYRIRDAVVLDITLELEDQFDRYFGAVEIIPSVRPAYFLTPAVKNYEEPLHDSVTHYVAYEIFPNHYYDLLSVQTSDQFGMHILQVDTSKFLLVPTVKLRAEPPPNDPPVIGQPDFLEGYVDDVVSYDITGSDPNGDVILDDASIDIQPGCGSWNIVRISGHGTSSGVWEITWDTEGCTPCDTHMVIHDLTDEHGATGYCTTWVHLSEYPWLDHKMHYPQLPDLEGWDVFALDPKTLADDWQCSETGWVTDIHFWGSWKDVDGDAYTDDFFTPMPWFRLSIHRNIPASADTPWSRPGELLWFWEGEIPGTPFEPPAMEHWFNPNTGEVLYNDHIPYWRYDFFVDQASPPADSFFQYQDSIYWLDVSALYIEPPYEWGWKSSRDHFMDDAVYTDNPPEGPWYPLFEPPRANWFDVYFNSAGEPVDMGSTNYYGEGWYAYEYWWNMWFYNNPFVPNPKHIWLEFYIEEVGPAAYAEFAINWSTDLWSTEGVPGRPPLPGEDETLYIGRQIFEVFPGSNTIDFWIDDYNPEWVSVDFVGTDVVINGWIWHECVQTSMDLAFVITGHPAPPNDPPEIGQPDFLEGFVDDTVQYDITGTDPNGDIILDSASIVIVPGCGSYWIARTSGHGTSSGTWQVTWLTTGCTPCDTHMVIHDLTDQYGATGYCTTWVHLSRERECDDNDPHECDTLYVECGNMRVPPGGGLVKVDLTIAFDESLKVFQVPLSYEGSPVCCDSMPDSENTVAQVFAGSIIPATWIKIVNIDHQNKEVVVAGTALMAPTDCLMPGRGQLGTLTLFGDSCCTIQLDTTDWSNNHVGFMDCNDPSMTLFYPVCRIDTCHIDRNYPPVIGQPDFLEGLVDDVVEYDITGTDPDGDAIEDDASIDIQPGCGSWNIVRTSGHGTSSGTWTITWDTYGCTPCDTHMVIHDLTDVLGATSYCTTLVHLSQPESLYWKPPYEDYAPSGMVDIDQKQDGWMKFDTEQWSFCGPCAVANCFKWFDSKYNQPPGVPGDAMDQFPLVRDYTDNLPPIWTGWDDHSPENVDHPMTPWQITAGPPPATPQPFIPGPQPPGAMPPFGELVERLAWYFDTDGIQTGYCNHTGTNILQMQQGIQDWFESEMFEDSSTIADTLCMELTPRPTFAYVESLVEKCEDVILLLGFWYEEPEGSGEWFRIGGHYVTVAGVNSERYRIAFSDPFIDAAEFGAPGRIGDGMIIPHSFPHDPTVHNDEGNVSHDIYTADTASISPGGDWWLPDYAINGDPGYWSWNFYAQNVPDEFHPFTMPWNGTSGIFTEVEYCIHISPWDYRGDVNVPGGDGVVDIADVVFLLNYLFKGGDPPEPLIEGDTSCDGIVDLSDVIILLNYLFKGGPVPKCCDP
jgi:hypothetical protein